MTYEKKCYNKTSYTTDVYTPFKKKRKIKYLDLPLYYRCLTSNDWDHCQNSAHASSQL